MAIPTVFDITFGCGHAGAVDAADRADWPGLAGGAIPVVTGR